MMQGRCWVSNYQEKILEISFVQKSGFTKEQGQDLWAERTIFQS